MALTTTDLAGRAAQLSTELYSLQERCTHVVTSSEISSIADELARLSTTLWHLHEAISVEPDQYTPAFNQDLVEINTELALVLEEISDCCSEMQKTDSLDSPVPWFFKKGRVGRLTKHLEALKGTLSVMRTVLWHGKEYGTQNAPGRLAESSPHTMHEDRVILESLLARNRNAILDLHKIDTSLSRSSESTKISQHSDDVRHSQRLSDMCGVDIPPIPDVLPPSLEEAAAAIENEKLARTFSKRGVRLGVHMSILDLNAHDAPLDLKKKWIHQSRLRSRGDSGSSNQRSTGLTALPELSKISEVETNPSRVKTDDSTGRPSLDASPASSLAVEPSESFIASPKSKQHRRSIDHSSIGKSMKQIMRRLSLTSTRLRKDDGKKGKEREDFSWKEKSEDSSLKTPDSAFSQQKSNSNVEAEGTRKPKLLHVISKPFQHQSPLNTPDFDREFENGTLA